MPKPMILDTDIGTDVDDAVALLLACASPEVDLLAVTTCGGDTQRRARLAKKLLATCGRKEVAVYQGMSGRLLGYREDMFRPYDGHGVQLGEDSSVGDRHAVEYLLSAAEGAELVAIGPQSNLGAAFALDERLAGRLSSLKVMGGSFWTDREEYNVYSDPEAAKNVLQQPLDAAYVGLDVTREIVLREGHLTRLLKAGSHLTELACSMLSDYREKLDLKVNHLHDPLALATAFTDEFVAFEETPVDVDVETGKTKTGIGQTKRVAKSVDADGFLDFLLGRIAALGDRLDTPD